MSEDSSRSSVKLLQVQTSGFSLGSVLLLMLAAAFAILQLVGFLDGINPDKSLAVQLVPAGISVGITLLVILRGRRRGELTIYQDRIGGTRHNGLPISISLDQVHTVDLKPYMVALKDEAGTLLLLQRLPGKTDGGLLWLLVAYRDWEATIWEHFPASDAPVLTTATRHFLADDGSASFGDIGFILATPAETWFFPASPTVDIQGLGSGQLRMNQRASGQHDTQLQFQPQPDWLPLDRFCKAIMDAPLADEQKIAYLAELAENHGGCQVKPAVEGMEGECLGYPVRVYVNEGNAGSEN